MRPAVVLLLFVSLGSAICASAAPADPSVLAGWWHASTPQAGCSAQVAKFSADGFHVRSVNVCGGSTGVSFLEIDMVYTAFTTQSDGSIAANVSEVFVAHDVGSSPPPSPLMVRLHLDATSSTLTAFPDDKGGAVIVFARSPATAFPLKSKAYAGQGMPPGGSPSDAFDVHLNVDGPVATSTSNAGGESLSFVLVQHWDAGSGGLNQTFVEGALTPGTWQLCSYALAGGGDVVLSCCPPGACTSYPGMQGQTTVTLKPSFS